MIVGIQAKHSFTLKKSKAFIFKGNIHTCTAIDNGFIDDRNGTHTIVYRVVYVLGKQNASSRYTYRSRSYPHSTKTNRATLRSFVLPTQQKFILFCHLPCCYWSHFIQLRIAILLYPVYIYKFFRKSLTKRFHRIEINQAQVTVYSIPFYIVEYTIGVRLVARV